MIIDEVTTVPTLVLVVVGLGDDLVGEVLVLGKLKDEAETRLVEVLHADIGQVLEGTLVAVGDHLSKRDLVLHGGQPELRNAVDLRNFGRLLLLLLGRLGLGLGSLQALLALLTQLNLLIGGLGLAVHDSRTLLIKRSELGKVLLLKLKNLLLELSLELGMLLLDALQASNTALDLRRERLDIAGRLANKVAETILDQGDEAGVLGKDGSGSDTFQILC